jgi:two-component system sensor histidine kinase UhpB
MVYAPIPLFLWAAIRFGVGGLSMSLLGVAPFAIWNAMHGRGPFIFASPDQNILALKVFFSATACPLMLLSAYISGLQQSNERLIVAQEQERRRIGRELHDDVAQRLILVQLELEEAREVAGDYFNDRLRRLYDQVAEAATATRDISHGLHPSFLEHTGLAAALRGLAWQISRGRSLQVHFVCENVPLELPASSALCVYRVAQETLQNVVKHSQARDVTIELGATSDWLSLNIADDGIGFNPATASEGLGLISMRERVESAGGTISITSVRNKGTKARVSLPLKPK